MINGKIVLACLILPLIACYNENNALLLEGTFFETEIDSVFYYEYVLEDTKELLYSEDFNDLDTDWWTGENGELSADIRFGEYQLENNDRDVLQWIFATWSIDPDRNFDLEATIRVNNSNDDDGGGFGLSDTQGNLITLIMNHKNEVSINKWDANQSELTRPLDWEEKYWIDSFHGTILTIRKLNDQYIFFADQKYIGVSLNQQELSSTRIVFYFKGDAEMYVDAVSLHYINE